MAPAQVPDRWLVGGQMVGVCLDTVRWIRRQGFSVLGTLNRHSLEAGPFQVDLSHRGRMARVEVEGMAWAGERHPM
jgi:hypothetical protein